MSIELLGKITGGIGSPLSLLWLYCILRAGLAVKGTDVRRAYNTWVVGTSVGLVLDEFVLTGCYLYQSKYLWAGFATVAALIYGFYGWKHYKDDNWFKDQFDKLKTGIKNMAKRIVHSLTPSPNGSPA